MHPAGLVAVACTVTVVVASPVVAQDVAGRVVDRAQAPVADAEVRPDGDATKGVLSGEDGRFALPAPTGYGVVPVFLEIVPADGGAPTRIAWAEAQAGNFVLTLAQQQRDGNDVLVIGRRISSVFAPQAISKLEIVTDPTARADALLSVAGLPASTNTDDSADVELRGSAAGLSQVLFNDVPLYEVVRGSTLDRVTRGTSIFSPSIVRDLEVYPTNPPIYLANATAGAVRILPDDDATGSSTAFVGLTGLNLTKKIALSDSPGDALQAYAGLADLTGLLALNPGLRDTTKSFTSAAGGGVAHASLPGDTKVVVLGVVDAERGRYVVPVPGGRGDVTSRRTRFYTIVSVERPVGSVRIKADGAFTRVTGRQTFAGFGSRSRNSYGFGALDLSGQAPALKIEYRLGIAAEIVDLDSRSVSSGGTIRRGTSPVSGYAYLNARPAPFLEAAVGVRVPVAGNGGVGRQGSLALTSADRRHKIIAGAGRYFGRVLPEIATAAPLATARSDQVSLDYAFTGKLVSASAGMYLKEDRVAGRRTTISGLDTALRVQATDRLKLSGSFTTARPRIADAAGDPRAGNYLSYLVRLSAGYQLSATVSVNAAYVARSGTPYTRVTAVSPIAPGAPASPIFGRLNDASLAPFRRLDLNLVADLDWFPGATKPLGFVAVSNAFDRRNEARIVYDLASVTATMGYYERRAVTAGLVFQLR